MCLLSTKISLSFNYHADHLILLQRLVPLSAFFPSNHILHEFCFFSLSTIIFFWVYHYLIIVSHKPRSLGDDLIDISNTILVGSLGQVRVYNRGTPSIKWQENKIKFHSENEFNWTQIIKTDDLIYWCHDESHKQQPAWSAIPQTKDKQIKLPYVPYPIRHSDC